jgi:hypothetical protein
MASLLVLGSGIPGGVGAVFISVSARRLNDRSQARKRKGLWYWQARAFDDIQRA